MKLPPAGMVGLCAPLCSVGQKKLCGNVAGFLQGENAALSIAHSNDAVGTLEENANDVDACSTKVCGW